MSARFGSAFFRLPGGRFGLVTLDSLGGLNNCANKKTSLPLLSQQIARNRRYFKPYMKKITKVRV